MDVDARRSGRRRSRPPGNPLVADPSSDARYRAFFAHSLDAALLTTLDGRILDANPAACRVFDRTLDDLRRVGRAGVVDPNDPRLSAALAERARVGRFRGELTLRRRDGASFPAEVASQVFTDADGEVRTSMIVRDLTARQAAEAQLGEERRFVQETLDALTAHIAVLDETGAIVAVNAAWRRFADANGLRLPGHGLGANYLEPIAAAGADEPTARAMADGIRAVLAGEQAEFVLEYPCHSPEEERWFVCRVTRFAGPGPTRVVVAHEPVTERVQAEAALRESESRFRAMADTTPVIIWATNARGEIEFVNRAYRAYFGVTKEQEQGLNWQRLLHPDDAEGYAGAFLAALRAQAPFHAETRVRRADGEWRWIESYAAPRYSERGDLLGMVGSSPDITERKQAEAERLAFLDALAHDVKNPLGAALGQTQLLRRRLRRGLASPEQLDANLGGVEAAIRRATGLIDELLDVARLRAGARLELRPAPLDLVALARAAVETAQRATDRHVVRLEARIPELTGEWDGPRLARVLDNLLGNAIKFSPDGGEIVARVARAESDGRPEACLSVEDHGVGIPAADLPHVFTRFRRARNVAGRIAGAGIGLSGARQIVEQHGGSVSVESAEGRGSTFTVRLPLRSTQ